MANIQLVEDSASKPFSPLTVDGKSEMSRADPETCFVKSALQYELIIAVAPFLSVPGVGDEFPESISPFFLP